MGVTLSGCRLTGFCLPVFAVQGQGAGDALAELAAVPALIFYETAPRLIDSLTAIAQVLPGREVAWRAN
jgi:16S rRNA (cytidine1402-2'-O)-methyltransferase